VNKVRKSLGNLAAIVEIAVCKRGGGIDETGDFHRVFVAFGRAYL
jgi:hypothetical protein